MKELVTLPFNVGVILFEMMTKSSDSIQSCSYRSMGQFLEMTVFQLYHEWGHALHSLLSTTKYVFLSAFAYNKHITTDISIYLALGVLSISLKFLRTYSNISVVTRR